MIFAPSPARTCCLPLWQVPGTPKGDLATALWTAYNDVNTNGLWMSYNDSGSIGYWNHNGDWNGHSGDRQTWHMYRAPGTDSGCPAITTGSCSTTQLGGTAPPTSCAAVPTSCQSLYSVEYVQTDLRDHFACPRYPSVCPQRRLILLSVRHRLGPASGAMPDRLLSVRLPLFDVV